ncbi:30S ribosomal protein S16 [Candidatus Jorgensenbacteria bacterium]|nr:30S ribosomal protein S16 [Candidatus Jorgensenbacteria bacterium]
MLAIKLKRVGKKHQASFRVVVMEKRSKLQGRFIEDLGWWDPRADKGSVNPERAKYWISVGAHPTPSMHNLLVKTGVLNTKKIPVHKAPKKIEKPSAEAAVGAKTEAAATS